MRVYLDGQFFAEWDRGLAELAEFAGVAVERLSPDIGQLCARQLATINASCDASLAVYRAAYPAVEQATWPKQDAESAAWVAWADGEAPDPAQEPPTPTLDGIAAARGLARTELIRRAHAKAQRYAALAAEAVGVRQALEDQLQEIERRAALPDTNPEHIDHATALTQLQAIQWSWAPPQGEHE